MSHRYIFELGCEEIPARFMMGFIRELTQQTEKALSAYRLSAESVRVVGTYRRLVIDISGLANKQTDLDETCKGPPADISFDSDQQPLPPAIGFAKRCGMSPSELRIHDGYVVGYKREKGAKTCDILSEMLLSIWNELALPIAMRWHRLNTPFFRPVQWIMSILDDTVLPIDMFNISASNISYGHRYLTDHPDNDFIARGVPITISHADAYDNELERAYVCVDHVKRRKIIYEALLDTMRNDDIDEELLNEVVFLVEWPALLKGRFDKRYLSLPDDVLIACMKKHQKYFPVLSKKILIPEFLVVADNVTKKNQATILEGNQQVLTARLEDVLFFWEEDIRVPLEDQAKKLENVIFQKDLGSMKDKVDRLQMLGDFLCTKLSFSAYREDIRQTIRLCKADLQSQMVWELPDLQGKMGALYAEKQGENQRVSKGIEEHYYPRFSGDITPESPTGIVTAIADKIDTSVACFFKNRLPTGSQDPLGIRRSLYGVAHIIFDRQLSLDLNVLIDKAYEPFGTHTNKNELISFFLQRIQAFIQDKGAAYDTVSAVLSAMQSNVLPDINDAYKRATELDHYRKETPEEFKCLVDTAIRVTRLAKKVEKKQLNINTSLFEKAIEHDVYERMISLPKQLTVSDAMTMNAPMTDYFDSVMVMDTSISIRENRLAFVEACDKIYTQIADFEKIVI